MAHPLSIMVITDGRAGNEVQALGLAEAIGRLTPAHIDTRRITLRGLLEPLPQILLTTFARQPESVLTDAADIAGWDQPDLVIGAGRRGAAVLATMRGGPRRIQILNPHIPPSLFDLVICPQHDGLAGDNVISTLGSLNRFTDLDFQAPPTDKRLAVLIGGPSGSARFDRTDYDRLVAELETFIDQGWTIEATPSRRTPAWLTADLRATIPAAAIWNGEGDNPYPGLLAKASAVLATGDSVNMLSEAAASGKPVYLSAAGRVSGKFRQFHEALAARGVTRPAADGPRQWRYEPLREADRVAPLALQRLGLAPS